MEKALLIADSGGTKTDWCLINSLGETRFFETESYHPNLVNEEWIQLKKEFWKEYTSIYELEVYFYGTGCLKETNQKVIKNAFQEWGMKNVDVKSDIFGAAKACFEDDDGIISILGTGSVMAFIENKNIKHLAGGLGSILGDEGSGYYFGKLLLQNYFHDKFTFECNLEITRLLGDRDTVMQAVYGARGKDYIANLPLVFSNTIFSEISSLHEENIRLFIEKYFAEKQIVNPIHFIGSYAYYNQDLLRQILEENGLKLGNVVRKPISTLTEYHKKRLF